MGVEVISAGGVRTNVRTPPRYTAAPTVRHPPAPDRANLWTPRRVGPPAPSSRASRTVEHLGGCAASWVGRTAIYESAMHVPDPGERRGRPAAGVSAGDLLDVEITLDTAPRTVTVPAELAEGTRHG